MKKTFALLLALIMVTMLTACLKQDASQPPASTPQPPANSQGTDVSTPPAFVPDPIVPELESAYLTGLEKTADYPEGQRITAIMLNNTPSSRPQNGVGDADILVEIRVEGGITRFMAIFEDYKDITRVGGLRSARDQFFQLLIPTQAFYVHEGPGEAEHPVNILMRNYGYEQFDITRNRSGFYVDTDPSRGVPKEYSWYDVSADGIQEAIDARELDTKHTYTSSFFRFHPYNEAPRVPTGGSATSIEVPHTPPSVVTYFDYDAASGKYGMSMGKTGTATDNNTGAQLMFENVVVVFAPIDLYNNSPLQKVDYSVGGGGFYFTQGAWEPLIWRKGAPDSPLLLYNLDESEMIEVNPGKTYLAVVDDELADGFYSGLTGA